MPQFTKKNSERPSGGGGGGHQRYVKTFREKRNPVTFLWDDPAKEFVHMEQHYDPRLQMWFPCAKTYGGEDCVGCSYPVENEDWTNEWLKDNWVNDDMSFAQAKDKRSKLDKGWAVRNTSGQWIFPAVAEDGYTNIYKIGYGLLSDLEQKYDELGTLLDQQFVVLCSDPGKLTNRASSMPTGKAPDKPKYEVPSKAEIETIMGDKYQYAYDKYIEVGVYLPGGQPDPDHDTSTPEPDEAQAEPVQGERPGDPASDQLAMAKATAEKAGEAPKASTAWTGIEQDDWDDAVAGGWDPFLDVATANAKTMMAWLDDFPGGPIEYPKNAPRSVLKDRIAKRQPQF